MAQKRDDALVLTAGSLYRIKSLESREKPMETVGVFKGYAALAHDTALVMELGSGEDKGKLRLIPSHMIICIDVLKAEKEKQEKESETNAVFYG